MFASRCMCLYCRELFATTSAQIIAPPPPRTSSHYTRAPLTNTPNIHLAHAAGKSIHLPLQGLAIPLFAKLPGHLLGPFHGAIAVPSVTRCRCCCCCRRRCRGHRCAGGVRRATVATPGEWQCKTASSGEWAQHFSNASCYYYCPRRRYPNCMGIVWSFRPSLCLFVHTLEG